MRRDYGLGERYDIHEIRRIALTAECDPRSVISYLKGRRGVLAMTIQDAIRHLGLDADPRYRWGAAAEC